MDAEKQIEELHRIAESIRAGRKDPGAVMLYGEEGVFEPIEAISTGSFLLDQALGVGGFPKGRVVELFGQEGSGKSSVALSTVAQAQRQGVTCLYVDAENAFSAVLAENIGVDLRLLMISQQSCTQDAFSIVDKALDEGVGLIVIDSIASLCPREELEGDFGDHHVGLQARWMSQAMRKLAEKIGKTKTAAILINQVRIKVGVFFGNPETTPGGKALKFWSSQRVDIKHRGRIKDGNEVVGIKMAIYVVKNKVAPPFRQCELDFYFDRGFDNELAYFDYAVAKELIFTKKGTAHYLWPDVAEKSKTRKGWGEFLKERPDVLKMLVDGVGTT